MLFYFACEAAGASSARYSLRPLIKRVDVPGKTRAKTRGEIAKMCLNVIASAAKQSILTSLLRDGLLRFARNDDALQLNCPGCLKSWRCLGIVGALPLPARGERVGVKGSSIREC
jgi:hypothetical protein